MFYFSLTISLPTSVPILQVTCSFHRRMAVTRYLEERNEKKHPLHI